MRCNSALVTSRFDKVESDKRSESRVGGRTRAAGGNAQVVELKGAMTAVAFPSAIDQPNRPDSSVPPSYCSVAHHLSPITSNTEETKLGFRLTTRLKVRMHRLLLYRGIYLYLFLLLFCTNYTLAQLVPTAFEQALDKDNRSAPEYHDDEQAAQKQGGIKLQQQPEQQQQQGQILSIVATTYLQPPRPTSLPAVAANPTRFDDEEQNEIKLLPAAPHQHQRKRKRDQAANILHILAHLARPFNPIALFSLSFLFTPG